MVLAPESYQDAWKSNHWLPATTYAYDSLNRLLTASGTEGGSNWGQQYGYDPFGNLLSKTVTAGSGPSLSVSVKPANNQIQGVSGLSYDANGNQSVGTYDAENRLSYAQGLTYAYDAQNKRIWTWNGNLDGSDNPTGYSVAMYSPTGQKLATYQLTPQWLQGWSPSMWMQVTLVSSDQYFGGRRLAVLDQLGSAGTYFPWGEDKGSTNPQNTWSFATYWRDSGTNLDYANNRYYSNAYGRFMTPDPYSGGTTDPQSWNKYSYTRGDPVNRSDPSGLGDTGDPCNICITVIDTPPPDFTVALGTFGSGGAPIPYTGPGSSFQAAAGQLAQYSQYLAIMSSASQYDQQINNTLHAQAANAFGNLSAQCAKALTADGINLNQVALNASSTVYYNTFFDGNDNVHSITGGPNKTLSAYLNGNVAASIYDANGNVANDVVLGPGFFGEDAVAQNTTLIHEALHTWLNLDDLQLAARLGLGNLPNTQAGADTASNLISAFLSPIGYSYGGLPSTGCTK